VVNINNLKNAKMLGGIGAILTLLSIIPTIGMVIGIVGFVLILIAVKTISDEVKDVSIFKNFLYFFITIIVGVVIFMLIMLATLQSVGGIEYFTNLQTITNPNEILSELIPFIFGILIGAIIFWVLAIIGTVFLKKSYKNIAKGTEVKWFDTVVLFFLIDAATSIILIGFLILLIANILEILY
jgi:uncharacterized membrane protein